MIANNTLMWFRRDLRVIDNPALYHAYAQGCRTAVFISTVKQWQAHDVAPIQLDFIERHLNLLARQLADIGIELIHLEAADFTEQPQILMKLCQDKGINTVYANSEVELNEQRRDSACIEQGKQLGINVVLFEADVIVAKGKVLNGENEMYKVFTPFRNAWLKQLLHTDIMPLVISPNQPLQSTNEKRQTRLDNQPPAITLPANKVCSKKWPLVSQVHQQVLNDFFQQKHTDYSLYRDIPSIKGTSGLSPYFAIGALSVKFVVYQLMRRVPDILSDAKSANFSWLNELAWRDFYKHLLYHQPRLCRHEDFQLKYQGVVWPNNADLLQAWQEARTGYPLVDAAMKQLLQTGWMHNRLRMVVASFLTKHLLVDWRLGEKFFMQHLIDGDFSANNGGWQWAASTGCDAQPYFRVFNPIRQSERFDPDGSFIRKYLPELNDVPTKYIHFPHDYIDKYNRLEQEKVDKNNTEQAGQGSTQISSTQISSTKINYSLPIVDHKTARLAALDFYKR